MYWSPDFALIDAMASSFDSVSLTDLGKAKLMNRTDTKYVLPACQLTALLEVLRKDYRWLEVDGLRLCPYETLYYDTADLQLYHAHQTGRMNRYKIRQRRYAQSNLTFIEVKQKNQKKRTVKNRVRCPDWTFNDVANCPDSGLDSTSRMFVQEQMRQTNRTLNPDLLQPVLWVGYTRLTFVSNTTAERLTLDLNLTFQNATGRVSYPDLLIAELKQDARQPSAFSSLMRQQRRREGGVSKYCLGLISLNPTLRQNQFKPQFKRLCKVLDRSFCK